MRHDSVDDEIDGMARVEIEGRRRQNRPVQPGIAMDLDGQNLVADQQTPRALRHRHHDAIGRATGQRIACGVVDVVIARYGGDAEQVNRRVCCCEQDGNGVIVTGVAVENDFFHDDVFCLTDVQLNCV
jgi:hypothetical protein